MARINQPMYILRDDTERFQGNQALRMNIFASQILASIVRTTLGPKGMDKMLVDKKMGDVVVTNDGATILQEMDIAHPAAKMLVEIARKQEHVVGDGTTTVVIIAGELLKKLWNYMKMELQYQPFSWDTDWQLIRQWKFYTAFPLMQETLTHYLELLKPQ